MERFPFCSELASDRDKYARTLRLKSAEAEAAVSFLDIHPYVSAYSSFNGTVITGILYT